MNLQDKSVLITGGSMGIGLSLANKMSTEGAKVMICGRNLEPLEAAKRLNPKLEIAVCDVTKLDDINNLYHKIMQRFGKIDILVNNAAVFRRFNILDNYSIEKQIEEIDINLKGPVQVTNVFLKELLKSSAPTIINVTSGLGYVPMTGAQIYSATKAAINSWTESLRHQLQDTAARVVLISPPVVDTRMNVNNPGTEGMKKISPDRFAELTLKSLKKGKNEILVSPINALKFISRIAPKMAFKQLNK